MSISIYIATKPDWEELIVGLLKDQYSIDKCRGKQIYRDNIKPHFDALKDDVCFLAETGYVDAFYRDSYYYYYSSKFKRYERDCIKISLFRKDIRDEDFFDPSQYEKLQTKYLGFYVLRPTFPMLMGRSVISPLALKDSSIKICTCVFSEMACGLEFKVDGFPHSSQDTESISCAETALWAIMEYFGHKYSYYKKVLPSEIIEYLKEIAFERQIPSRGLIVDQMSFVLKKCGLAPVIYSREDFECEFDSLLACYVESAIPLIVAFENDGSSVEHALIVVGRESGCEWKVDNIYEANGFTIIDYDSLPKKFVFVDDNKPVYQKAYLSEPAGYYADSEWKSCKINYFIVPFYQEVYVEARYVKNYIINFLFSDLLPISKGSEVIVRTFLVSSESYKNELMCGNGIDGDLKYYIVEKQMPKFIWVGELSTKVLIKEKKANGVIILDATEANNYNNLLIVVVYEDTLIKFDEHSGFFQQLILHCDPFPVYDKSLKSFT